MELEPLPKEARAQRGKIRSELVGREYANREAEERIEKIELKVSDSRLNGFRMCYEVEGNSLTKKRHPGKWSPLLCENVLPLKGQCFFSVAVLRSL